MTTWRRCTCKACGHELLTFRRELDFKNDRCPKCGSTSVESEPLEAFNDRAAVEAAGYIFPKAKKT